MPQIVPGRDPVIHQGIFQDPPPAVVSDILHKRHADALQNTALRLHPDQVQIQRCPAVHTGVIFQHLRFSGLRVHLQLHSPGHEGWGRCGRDVGLRDLQRKFPLQEGSIGDLLQRHEASPGVRNDCARQKHLLPVKFDLLRRNFQDPGAEGTDFLPQLPGGFLRRIAGQERRAGSIGAGIVGRGVRIAAGDRHAVQAALQHLRCDLGHGGVRPGPHIAGTQRQCIKPVIVQLQPCGGLVDPADTGALHADRHADAPDLSVRHDPRGILFIPADHPPHLSQTAVQSAAGVRLSVICRHDLALAGDVLQPQVKGIPPQNVSQFIDCGLHREKSLGRPVTAVRPGRLHIGVDHVVDKAVRLLLSVYRDRLVAAEPHRRRPVLPVGAGV